MFDVSDIICETALESTESSPEMSVFYSVLNYSCCPQAPDAQGSLACLSQAGEVV